MAEGKPACYLQAWPERIWTRDYREQIQLAVGAGLEQGASKSSALTNRPRCLLKRGLMFIVLILQD